MTTTGLPRYSESEIVFSPGAGKLQSIAGDRLHVMFRVKYPGVPHERVSTAIRLLGQVRDQLQVPVGA